MYIQYIVPRIVHTVYLHIPVEWLHQHTCVCRDLPTHYKSYMYIIYDIVHVYTHQTLSIHPLTYSLTHSLHTHSPTLTPFLPCLFTHSLTNSPTHPLTHHSLTHPPIYPSTHSPIHPFTHPPTHSSTHPLTHLPTHSPNHPPTHPSTHPWVIKGFPVPGFSPIALGAILTHSLLPFLDSGRTF